MAVYDFGLCLGRRYFVGAAAGFIAEFLNMHLHLQQIIGWVLVFGGLAVVFYGLYTSFFIFTGQKEAPELFSSKEQSVAASMPSLQAGSTAEAQELAAQLLQQQLGGIFPADSINRSFNLVAWSIFAWILIMGGGQIAGIGVKLLAK